MAGRQRFPEVNGIVSFVNRPRRIPRAGIIRLGRKIDIVDQRTRVVKGTRPTECKHFVVDALPDVQRVFGPEPLELRIMFPNVDIGQLLRSRYAAYRTAGAPICIGDGITGHRAAPDGSITMVRCCDYEGDEPACDWCDDKRCRRNATLSFMIPECSIAGCYQLGLGGYQYIGDLMDSLAWCIDLIGSVSMVPLILYREPVHQTYTDEKGQHSRTGHTVKVKPAFGLTELIGMRQRAKELLTANRGPVALPEPPDHDPTYHDPADVIEDAETGEQHDARTGAKLDTTGEPTVQPPPPPPEQPPENPDKTTKGKKRSAGEGKAKPGAEPPPPADNGTTASAAPATPAPAAAPPVQTSPTGGVSVKRSDLQPGGQPTLPQQPPLTDSQRKNLALAKYGRNCKRFSITTADELIRTAGVLLNRTDVANSSCLSIEDVERLVELTEKAVDELAEVEFALSRVPADHQVETLADLDQRFTGWRTKPDAKNRLSALDYLNQ